MYQSIMGGNNGGGGTNPAGSQPANETVTPNPLGGSPAAPGGGNVPSPAAASTGAALSNNVSGVFGLGKPVARQP